jgi:hypothetical protein
MDRDDIESILDNDAPDYASTLTGADEEDNIIQRYLNDHHDSTIVRILMKRFQGIYIPKISIEKEIKKYRCVGVDEKVALPKGCLITISRKWSSRAKDAEKRGKKVVPDLYYASPELVQRASVQQWKGVNLRWLEISDLEIVKEGGE